MSRMAELAAEEVENLYFDEKMSFADIEKRIGLPYADIEAYIIDLSADLSDYPDPENFFFLLLGAQSKVKSQDENASNYANPEFDRLFEKMKNAPNSPKLAGCRTSPARQALYDRMLEILRLDTPWLWGFHHEDYALYHAWIASRKARRSLDHIASHKKIRSRS